MARTFCLLCRCHGEIDRVIDLRAVQASLSQSPQVLRASVTDNLCDPEVLARELGVIRDAGIPRVLVAGCSVLFARGGRILEGLRQSGISPANMEFVDLREGCAWIHSGKERHATGKAIALVRMGLAALALREASADAVITVRREVMVIGAGPAGWAATRALVRMGIPVQLVERTSALGGMLPRLSRLYPADRSGPDRLRDLMAGVADDPLVRIHRRSRLEALRGYAGAFQARLRTARGESRTLTAGAIIVATGAAVHLPLGDFRYGEFKAVITQMELETRLEKGMASPKRTLFIQCVGARSPERPYCSTICCPISLKNAIRLREQAPDAEVFILQRDIMTPGRTLEAYYRRALAAGVQFIRFDPAQPPEILGGDYLEAVQVFDAATGAIRRLSADLVVLSTPLVPHRDTATLAAWLDLPLDRHGFFREDAPLNPLETPTDGVFLCGSARWPVSSEQAIRQGEAAAAKAAALVRPEKLSAKGLGRLPIPKAGLAAANADRCSGCGQCVAVCPYHACRLQVLAGRSVSRVIKMRCQACGSCAAVCPNGSIGIPEQSARVFLGMIKQAFALEAVSGHPTRAGEENA